MLDVLNKPMTFLICVKFIVILTGFNSQRSSMTRSSAFWLIWLQMHTFA